MGDVVRLHGPATEPEPLWREVLGQRVRRRRLERRETLADTAGRAGISPQYLSEVERGIKDPSSEVVGAIAGALDLTVLQLQVAAVHDLASRTATQGRLSGPLALAA